MILYNIHVVHVDSKEIYVQAIAAKKAMHCAGSPGVEVPTPRCLALALLWSDLNRRWAPAPMPRPRHFPWKRGWAPRLESLFTVKTEFLMPWIAMIWYICRICHLKSVSSRFCRLLWEGLLLEWSVSKSEHYCICTCLLVFIVATAKKDIDYRLSWLGLFRSLASVWFHYYKPPFHHSEQKASRKVPCSSNSNTTL